MGLYAQLLMSLRLVPSKAGSNALTRQASTAPAILRALACRPCADGVATGKQNPPLARHEAAFEFASSGLWWTMRLSFSRPTLGGTLVRSAAAVLFSSARRSRREANGQGPYRPRSFF